MKSLIRQKQAGYLADSAFLETLGREGICVLSDFLQHPDVMDAFWSRYYGNQLPREVICGLNPGRLGAGLTGVPFTDFQTLSRWLPGIERQDTEPSAQFFAKVVDAMGVEAFFRRFYVTNVSAVGYVKDGKNLNYHDLPEAALRVVERNFMEEMAAVGPVRIIALGRQAYATAIRLLSSSVGSVEYLPHPSWIMRYHPHDVDEWAHRYSGLLGGGSSPPLEASIGD